MTGSDQNDNHSHAVEETDSTPHQIFEIQQQHDDKVPFFLIPL